VRKTICIALVKPTNGQEFLPNFQCLHNSVLNLTLSAGNWIDSSSDTISKEFIILKLIIERIKLLESSDQSDGANREMPSQVAATGLQP
jgi:hypothetical protein